MKRGISLTNRIRPFRFSTSWPRPNMNLVVSSCFWNCLFRITIIKLKKMSFKSNCCVKKGCETPLEPGANRDGCLRRLVIKMILQGSIPRKLPCKTDKTRSVSLILMQAHFDYNPPQSILVYSYTLAGMGFNGQIACQNFSFRKRLNLRSAVFFPSSPC